MIKEPVAPQNKPTPPENKNQATIPVANEKEDMKKINIIRGELAMMRFASAALSVPGLRAGIINPIGEIQQQAITSSLEVPEPENFSVKKFIKEIIVSVATNVIIASLHLI